MMLCFEIFMFFEFSTSVRTEWVIGISGINEYVKKITLRVIYPESNDKTSLCLQWVLKLSRFFAKY